MIENILTNYRSYVEGCKGAEDAHKAGLKELHSNYKGDLLRAKIEALESARRATVLALRAEYITPIRESFDEAKAAIRSVSVIPIPDNVMNSLTAFDGLKISDEEKAQILELTKHSYLARKRAIELMNITDDELPPSIDKVLGEVDCLEKFIVASINKPIDHYDVRLIAHGDWISRVQNEMKTFCDTYSA